MSTTEQATSKERGILFNAEMVRAILEGRKTQTRRIMKPQPELIPEESEYGEPGYWIPFHPAATMVRNQEMAVACPLGQPGDRLWVRETFTPWRFPETANIQIDYAADDSRVVIPGKNGRFYKFPKDAEKLEGDQNPSRFIRCRRMPSIHMPRWASRINLLITGVRVERLQSITLGDICKELGCGLYDFFPATDGFRVWTELWKSIYGEESWNANPWVWVIEFERLAKDGGQ